VLVAVPNIHSVMARLFGWNWHGWDPPYHLTHFSATSLRWAAESAGLEVSRIYSLGDPEDLTRSLALRNGESKRRLFLRAAMWPPSVVLGTVGAGAAIIGEFRVPN
jgi:hypothetical protein